MNDRVGADFAPTYPPGPYTLEDVLARNSEWIIPQAWRELGATECLRRVREMREKNLALRAEIRQRFEEDEAFRKEEMRRCAEDLVYWCTRWAVLYNADARQAIPFLPIEFQVREVLYPFYRDQYVPLDEDNLEADPRNHMGEKPRKVGFTYCVLFGGAWAMCFHHLWPLRSKTIPHVGGVAADVKDNVKDRENPESHLGRLEQILRALPVKMLPGRIREDEQPEEEGMRARRKGQRRRGNTFGETKISFPENKSFIRAVAASRNAGRAGRFSYFLFDEEEFSDRAKPMVRSLMDATNCLWRVSSVNGKGNSFHRDWSDEKLMVTRHRIRYWMVPWYDDAWLAVQREKRSPEDFRREILCDRDARGEVAFWAPPFAENVNVVDADLAVNPTQPLWVGLDIGKADGFAILYLQREPANETVVCHGMVYRRYSTLEWFVPFLLGEFRAANEMGDLMPPESEWHPLDRQFVREVGAKMKAVPQVRFVAGSDAKQESVHYDSLIVQMRRMWKLTLMPVRLNDKREAIDAVKWMVPYLRVSRRVNLQTPGQYDSGGAAFTFSDVFYQYRKKVNRQTEEVLPSGTPEHDQFSNPADAMQYLVHEMPQVMRRTPKEIERAIRAKAVAVEEARKALAVRDLFRGLYGRRPVHA